MDYSKVITLAKRRGILWPSYDIYQGVRGFYDYGPLGALLKHNIEKVWRDYYIIGEGFAEIECPNIAPEIVFKASGHLEKFQDILVECKSCGESFRADHLLADDNMDIDGIRRAIKERDIRCLECGGELSEPKGFNLMFKTQIGARSDKVGYLRPETAQGMFLNFALLYRYFREKLPFGVVQIGRGFRNEISPRQGLIRVRELNMAEAEVFVNPKEKTHPRFNELKDENLTLVPQDGIERRMSASDAVEKRIINNECLAYYIALTKKFLIDVGVDEGKLRFRQHLQREMAHYAEDCWDAEALLYLGEREGEWIELVGIADRTCYDLERHQRFSGEDLTAFIQYDEPKDVEKEIVEAKMNIIGKEFKKDAMKVKSALEALSPEEIRDKDSITLKIDDAQVSVSKDAWKIVKVREKVHGEKIFPHVIEPSYGIDRIFYTVLEHSYFERDGYTILKLSPRIAPIKVGVFPLMAKDGLDEKAKEINNILRTQGIMTYYDESGSIGRRYARMDEIGTPYCVTIDYDTLKDGTVTIRDRDTTEQERVSIEELDFRLKRLVE